MPYTTELSDDCMGIHQTGKGHVTGAEILEACRGVTQLFQNTENFNYEFIDFSEVTKLEISEEELNQIIAQDRYAAFFRPDAVIVIVAPSEEQFESAKEWERRGQGIGWLTHVSRDRAEAEQWLREHYPAPPAASDPAAEVGSSPADPPAFA